MEQNIFLDQGSARGYINPECLKRGCNETVNNCKYKKFCDEHEDISGILISRNWFSQMNVSTMKFG